MSKYLSFSGAGLKFLLPIDNIVELYDAGASSEAIDKVMVGADGQVYWRGVLSCLLNVNALFGMETGHKENCFIVGKNNKDTGNYCILKVDAIHDLLDVHAEGFREIDMNNPNLKVFAGQVYIVPGNDQLFYVMHELDAVFSEGINAAVPAVFDAACQEPVYD